MFAGVKGRQHNATPIRRHHHRLVQRTRVSTISRRESRSEYECIRFLGWREGIGSEFRGSDVSCHAAYLVRERPASSQYRRIASGAERFEYARRKFTVCVVEVRGSLSWT